MVQKKVALFFLNNFFCRSPKKLIVFLLERKRPGQGSSTFIWIFLSIFTKLLKKITFDLWTTFSCSQFGNQRAIPSGKAPSLPKVFKQVWKQKGPSNTLDSWNFSLSWNQKLHLLKQVWGMKTKRNMRNLEVSVS